MLENVERYTSENARQSLPYLFPDEIPALKSLAVLLPPNPTVVNIGAGNGVSGLALLESRFDLQLITIDITKESSPFGCLAGEELTLRKAGYWNIGRNEQIHGDSKEVGRNWDREKVDMVFVDGDHSYSGCSGDIKIWLKNIKPNGIIAIHDYDKEKVYKQENLPANLPHPQPWPWVDKAVNELLVGIYKQILLVNTLIAFRNKKLKR